MPSRLNLHTPELVRRTERCRENALHAMGEAAVHLIREQMRTGYPQPILRSGALMDSIAYRVEGETLRVGSPLPYATLVHEGTHARPGRPFLRDALVGQRQALEDAAAQALADIP